MIETRTVIETLRSRGGQPTEIVVDRSGTEQTLTVTPEQRGETAVIGVTLGRAASPLGGPPVG